MARNQTNPDEKLVHEIFASNIKRLRGFSMLSDDVMQQLNPETLDTIHHMEERAREERKGHSRTELMERSDMTPGKLARREQATITYLREALKKLREVHDVQSALYAYANNNLNPLLGGYDEMERRHCLSTAAAIWIMDQLAQQDKLNEMLALIPDKLVPVPLVEGAAYKDELYPLVLDSDYETDDIVSLARLICHRNDELVSPAMVHCPMGDEWTVSFDRKPTEGYPQRNAFEKIMAMLDAEAVQRAVKNFERKIWEFYKLAFKIDQVSQDRAELEARKFLKAKREQSFFQENRNVINLSSHPRFSPDDRNSLYGQLAEARLQQEYDAFLSDMLLPVFACCAYPNEREKIVRQLSGRIPKELSDRLIHFSVDDPYETCFAILWLLDQGSDLPWLTYGAWSVAYTALDQLPFVVRPAHRILSQNPGNLTPMLSGHRYPGSKFAGEEDSDGDTVNRTFGRNLSQLLFESTGTIWPRRRNLTPVSEELTHALDDLRKEGVNPYQLLLTPLAGKAVSSIANALLHMDPLPEETQPEQPEQEDLLKLKHQLSRQRRELAAYREEGHQKDKRIESLKDETDAQKDAMETMRQELAELREIVYRQTNGRTPAEPPVDSGITFPAHTAGKILSFGGHTSWLNAIRPLLPDVRFVSPDSLPNEAAIRNADVIWLQPNCLSHADFYKIIDLVRREEKPLHYFTWASAEKCAEQLLQICHM